MVRRAGEFAYMPQRDLLFPWRTVIDNTVVGLQIEGVSRREARRRAAPLMERFGLAGFEKAYPGELSGGMRQRAAFLRTVLLGRPAMLLDEPFGALDSLTRGDMQQWLLDVWSDLRTTVVFVTHDVAEAVYLSDRVYVMAPRPGRICDVVDVDLPRPRIARRRGDRRVHGHRAPAAPRPAPGRGLGGARGGVRDERARSSSSATPWWCSATSA